MFFLVILFLGLGWYSFVVGLSVLGFGLVVLLVWRFVFVGACVV